MKLESVSLPTDKQYLYYLIISQLYSDGHMEAAMKLEMSVLDTAGHVIPSNRLSSILSACLLSLSDVADYLSNKQSNAKPLTPPSPPTSLSNLNSLTRKRLHSGPPSLYPTTTESAPPVAPMVLLNQSNGGDNHVNTTTQQPAHVLALEEEESIQSQLSKELEEICNAAVQEVTSKVADNSPKQGDNVKIEPADVKVEPYDQDVLSPEPVPGTPLSNSALSTPLIGSAAETTPASADEATQNLINNLSNITSISEINEITELTQSLVESLVQGNTVFNDDISSATGENNNLYNVPPVASVTSPTKEEFIDGSDKSSPPRPNPLDTSFSPAQLVLANNTETFPQLNVYKQNNTLLNIMGYNCTNSRNKPFRRHRTRFNDEQVAAMERYYTNISRYARPDNGLPELIRETGLTHDTIMLWFQNKRARDKRKGWDDTGGGGSAGDGKRAKTE
ncbi:uncharacterized protein LOC134814232 isoform X2 [Bolinopsis microptera]|uniref:uncharacterized protein LOC134814232 isoform X2 n=1 Tax=Bolinopsis microptera TaxID=2820187 RepID=UPI00307A3326